MLRTGETGGDRGSHTILDLTVNHRTEAYRAQKGRPSVHSAWKTDPRPHLGMAACGCWTDAGLG